MLRVFASTVQYLERSVLLLRCNYFGNSVSDLPVCTTKFCSRLAVINKIHWCVALRRDGLRYKQTPQLSATNYSTVETVDNTGHSSSQKPDIGRKSRFLSQLVPSCYIVITFGISVGTRWCKNFEVDRIHERDRQTDGQTDRHRTTA